MKNKRMLIKFISSLLLGVFSLNAKAVCSTSDIAGTWKVFGGTTSADFHGYARGKLIFSSDGSLLTESSTLRSSGGTVVNFSSGQVNVSSSCKGNRKFFHDRRCHDFDNGWAYLVVPSSTGSCDSPVP